MGLYKAERKIAYCLSVGWCAVALLVLPQCANDIKTLDNIQKTAVVQPAAPAKVAAARCEVALAVAGRALKYCVQYNDISLTVATKAAEVCTNPGGGIFLTGGDCQSQSRVGSCGYKSAALNFTYYYYSPMTPEEARRSCGASAEGNRATAGSWSVAGPSLGSR